MKNNKTLDISIIGLMSALVFLGTYFFKLSTAFGYIHLGDCIIILTVCLFGTKKGLLAGSIGAGLADLIGGYAIWIFPTIILKALWAIILGSFQYRIAPNNKFSWLIGAVIGGIIHTAGYVLVNVLYYGIGAAAIELFPNAIQSLSGIILGGIAYQFLSKNKEIRRIQDRLK